MGRITDLHILLQILDDITLSNLDVIDLGGKLAGTLLERIDHTSTPFGRIYAMLCIVMVNVLVCGCRETSAEGMALLPTL